MSEQIHTTATPTAPPPPTNLLSDFRKLIPTLIISVLTAFGASWWHSQKSQATLENRVAQTEQRAVQNAENIKQNSLILQSNAIRLAEIGIIQNNELEQIKDLKQEQYEIKQLLNKK